MCYPGGIQPSSSQAKTFACSFEWSSLHCAQTAWGRAHSPAGQLTSHLVETLPSSGGANSENTGQHF